MCSPAGSTAGAFHSRSSSSLGALVLAPRANITEIDNDITAWFSKDDPVYRDYERFRERVRRHAHAHHRPQGRLGRSAVLARDPRDHRRDHRRHRARRDRPARQQPRHRHHRRGDQEPGRRRRRTRGPSAPRGRGHARSRRDQAARARGRPDPRRSRLGGRHRRRRSSSASTRIASTRSAPASSSRSTTSSIPRLPAGVRAYYNGSLEISETYNRITLDNQRKFTPPILLFTVLAIYFMFRSWRKTLLAMFAVLVSCSGRWASTRSWASATTCSRACSCRSSSCWRSPTTCTSCSTGTRSARHRRRGARVQGDRRAPDGAAPRRERDDGARHAVAGDEQRRGRAGVRRRIGGRRSWWTS